MSLRDLRRLEQLKAQFGNGVAAEKLTLLERLSGTTLHSAAQVLRLHEAICFLRAYPDDERVLDLVTRMLQRFDRRADLIRHRHRLADSGIAGTVIRYRFFWSTAEWLARRWPSQLRLQRDDEDAAEQLDKALPLITPTVAAEWFNAGTLPALPAIDELRGRSSDAGWLVNRLAQMPGDGFTREAFADAIDASFELLPGRDTPSRSRDCFAAAPRALQQQPLRRSVTRLRAAIAIPPRGIRVLPPSQARTLIDLARAAMVTRARDLMAFEYASPHDVRLVDDGDGLAFAFCGVVPQRRFLLQTLYGYLTLKNGVPIGYGQIEVLGRHASIAFNTYETFRGGEAAHVFSRLLAATRHVFGGRSYCIEPYQLGQDNEEAIESGAWWFYHKLGFRPRARAAMDLMRRENAKRRRSPSHRSSAGALRRLARFPLYFELEPSARPPAAATQPILQRAVRWLARRGGGAAAETAADTAARHVTGLKSLRGMPPGERLAWRRWAPLIASLPGTARWSAAERRQLAAIARAKGGRQEIDYLLRLAAHGKLLAAIAGGSH